jgi:hypothetical protein
VLESAIGTWADKAGAGLTGAIGGLVTGMVARQNARLSEAQLNAVGPDGKTVREHLAASQAQLDAALGAARAETPQPPADGSAFSA